MGNRAINESREVMNVGILTYHFSNNYGAVLQTYALQEKLRQLGHSPLIIDRTPIKADIIHKLYQLLNSNSTLYWRRFKKFANIYLSPTTRPFYTDEQLQKGISDYLLDAIVVGSDQIWRSTMCGHSYFLNFLPDDSSVRRISYAASFGKSDWDTTRADTNLIKDLLKRFQHVSVRENTGVEICKDIFEINAELVIDPTLLHDASFYEQNIIKDDGASASGKVVSYILGKTAVNMVQAANYFATSQGLAHTELYWLDKDLNTKRLSNFESHKSHISVEKWLSEIRDAEYVITNSFHCAVFSILFRKKFVVLEYASGGNDRLCTLLCSLGLEKRMVSDESGIANVITEEIDYAKCFAKLAALREYSNAYLINALNNKNKL